ncbi:MAG: hypothetical protein JWP97_6606 [Labilithrix sp.]|nr:hypothetical protein [Labilithrix sp.]
MHSARVRGPFSRSLLLAALCTAGGTGCGGAATPGGPVAAPLREAAPVVTSEAPVAPPPSEHWYFEWLSQDGRRALLRRLDAPAYGQLPTRVVDVDTGAVVAEDAFPEIGRLPVATVGTKPNEMIELVGLLAAPALADDLVRNAGLASRFPFGSCGRVSAAPGGGAIAFNVGDWIYVADRGGHVQKRLSSEAAYDARFMPDGKHLLFRRTSGMLGKGHAKYELHVVPADLSAPPRALAGTAGTRDRFAIDAEGKMAVAVASQEPLVKTCVLGIGLKPPFTVKKLACLEGGEPFLESVLSPSGRYAAITTQAPSEAGGPDRFHLRVIAVSSGKVVLDEPAVPGMIPRAVSDAGVLVQSGFRGILIDDLTTGARRSLPGDGALLGHRGFFRGASELVVVRGSTVGVVDLDALR